MTFQKKKWENRQSEFPNRRVLHPTETQDTYEIERAEGTVLQQGNRFDAAEMNDLERRIETTVNSLGQNKLGVPKQIPRGTDINTVTTPGLHYCASNADVESMANRAGNYAFALLVEQHAGVSQTWTEYRASADFKVFKRNFYAGTWSAWVQVYHSGTPPAWSAVANKPTAFAPTAHGHGWGEINGKPATFAPNGHRHGAADMVGGELNGIVAARGDVPGNTRALMNSHVPNFGGTGVQMIIYWT